MGLWASGLSIASSLGYRDANEASWSQLVQSVERMVDSTELAVLVDGDGGFGNSTMLACSHANFVRLARRVSRLRTAAFRS
ncbi:isocitrate lyase/phosphoenolpyruvate mutase family protein [Bradyrhizobium ottawaense]